jgi:hypothetical protein
VLNKGDALRFQERDQIYGGFEIRRVQSGFSVPGFFCARFSLLHPDLLPQAQVTKMLKHLVFEMEHLGFERSDLHSGTATLELPLPLKHRIPAQHEKHTGTGFVLVHDEPIQVSTFAQDIRPTIKIWSYDHQNHLPSFLTARG